MVANDGRNTDGSDTGEPVSGPQDDAAVDPSEYETEALETTPAEDAVIESELELAQDDGALPWLESSFEDEEPAGYDTGRLVGFALLGLLAIALVVGALWFFSQRGDDPELLADGSTIEAPDGPIKSPPEDAGGRTFEGTGNVAPAVGQGQTREGRLADDNSPRPSIDAAGSKASANKDADAGANSASASEGVGVQVGAFSSRARAEEAWAILRGQTGTLKGVKHRVLEGTVDGSAVYRLQAVAADGAAADTLCAALKADGLACQVKR